MSSFIPPRARGFTLVELLVSIVILSILLVLLASMVGVVQKTWTNTSAKIAQFQSARDAFQSMTSRLSLATLNTYWGYDSVTSPNNYIRISDLRYVNGPASSLLAGASGLSSKVVGQSVFFIAPENYQDNNNYSNLQRLLNTWGYFIQFDSDTQNRPGFLASLANNPAPRYRFRLMEMTGAPENLAIYHYTSGLDGSGNQLCLSYTGMTWFTDMLNSMPTSAQVLAENIVALILLPKLSKQEDPTGTALCPQYSYDSSQGYASGQPSSSQTSQFNTSNQLPPTIQVTMVAVDEVSYARYQAKIGTTQPTLVSATLFQQSANYNSDLQTLENALQTDNLNYRVFTSEVPIRGAKWSQNQTSSVP